jgi:peptidoglycan/LPS O-acetylase OafA/YrhL
LLLEERTETSRVDLVAFWRRRARRLLPALYFMLTVVCLWPLLMNRLGNYGWSSINLGTLRNYGISSLLYVTNWVVIATRQLYFAQFALPSPLAHTWSLAIEEQFYLVWPLVTLALLWRGAVSTRRTRGALVCAAVAVASAGLMAVLVHPVTPNSVNYVYNATSTRLFDLAAGAALAWLCVSREVSLVEARVLRWAAPVALLALAAAMAVAGTVDGTPKQYMFDGGFLVCAVLAAIVIAGVRVEGSLTARLFSLAPLMLIGRVSYGIYLWHWPIVTMVTPLSVHMDGWRLLVLRLGLLVALTAASYVLLEQPIRQKRWPLSARRAIAVVGVIVTTTAVVVGTSPANYSYPNPRIATARNAPASPPDGSGSIIGLDQFTWGAANPPSRAHPVTVLSLGDSLVAYAKPGLDAAVTSLPGVRFHSGAGPGFGFSGQA